MTDNKDTALDLLIEEIMTAPGTATALTTGELGDAALSVKAASATSLAEELELTAAATMLAGMPAAALEPMPQALRAKIAAQGAKTLAVPGDSNVTDLAARRASSRAAAPAGGRRWFSGLGWAAAAALLLALVLQSGRMPIETGEMDPTALRSALLQQSESISVPWSSSEIEQFAGVTGDVVWNNEAQRGYLRLVGMPANDPATAQYQLWIVDPDRDDKPIDGGVFDVTTAGAEVLIPIDAKLEVLSPAAFAITREQPGGVVVSEGPLLLVAAT